MTEKLGRYRLLKLIATGGMAEVFLATRLGQGPEDDRPLVIKRILRHLAQDQDFIDLFQHEAQLAIRLQHPNIAEVFCLEEEGGSFFIAMEYVEGRSLRQIFEAAQKRGVRVPPNVAVRIAFEALQGLHFAHELRDEEGRRLGILHRDVSPGNVLVSFSGAVKLIDFGIAKSTMAITRAGRVKGKRSYLAPEQTAAGGTVDRRADIYAMGLVLSEALGSEEESSLPNGLKDILARATAPLPGARFEDAAAMRDALGAWAGPDSMTETVAFMQRLFPTRSEQVGLELEEGGMGTSVHPAQKPRHHRSWFIPLGTGVALLLAVVGLFAWRPASETSDSHVGEPAASAPPQVAPPGGLSEPRLASPPPSEDVAPPRGQPEASTPSQVATPLGSSARPATGYVIVRVKPASKLFYRGKLLGTTPLSPIQVPAGRATFLVQNKRLGVKRRVSVKVPAGGSVVLKVDLLKR